MSHDYPRLLTDRSVVVIRNGQREATQLRAWLDGHDGPMPSYRIELRARLGNYTCLTPRLVLTCSRRWPGSVVSSNRMG
jgi:hypothetical protein